MNRQLFNTMVAQYGAMTGVDLSGQDIEWSGGVHCYLPSLKFYGGHVLSKVPTPDAPAEIYDHIGVYKINSSQDYLRLPNLRSINNYKDEWDYVTGKGLRYIHKVVLDGVSKYGKVTGYTVSETIRAAWLEKLEFTTAKKSGSDIVLSTHFKPRQSSANAGNIYVSGGNIFLIFDNTLYPNMATCNAWLAEQYANGTPVIVYYVMAEPIPFEERPQPYVPIPNDSGRISFVDGPVYDKLPPFELTYITHS